MCIIVKWFKFWRSYAKEQKQGGFHAAVFRRTRNCLKVFSQRENFVVHVWLCSWVFFSMLWKYSFDCFLMLKISKTVVFLLKIFDAFCPIFSQMLPFAPFYWQWGLCLLLIYIKLENDRTFAGLNSCLIKQIYKTKEVCDWICLFFAVCLNLIFWDQWNYTAT